MQHFPRHRTRLFWKKMNTLQLLRAIKTLPVTATGVFPADRIPVRWPRPYCLIANTDNRDKPGVQWIAVYLNDHGNAIYFDSYGLPPLVRHHNQRIRTNSNTYKWNSKRLQSFNSTVCGQYCLMFLYYMSYGYSLENFCNVFSDDCKSNDKIPKFRNNRMYKNGVAKGYGKNM